ncbi:uncharacterized protein LOC108024481 [Drosophila biarmipes]|uniref:uncharacterized protein LOC108024481 n=1 Tax=Drosophila biarmipes TaxID=125945 RepID=UPI0007E61C2D|nr:uncharacterized protein LOC108024481 [Drosophila biarmipes]
MLTLASHTIGELYELLVLDEEIFISCQDPDPGTLDVNGMINFSNLSTSMDADGITVSGNATSIWDIQQSDRIQVTMNILRLDRGTWMPTVLSITVKDFCTVMYDKNQYWFKYWTQYILNDVKDKCLNAGTQFVHQTFVLRLTASATGSFPEGRYKAHVVFRAFDSSDKERPTCICFEVQGDAVKIRTTKSGGAKKSLPLA